MKKKLTSYQKLKKENQDIKDDIYNLISDDVPHMAKVTTRVRWKNIFETEQAIMLGQPTKSNT